MFEHHLNGFEYLTNPESFHLHNNIHESNDGKAISINNSFSLLHYLNFFEF